LVQIPNAQLVRDLHLRYFAQGTEADVSASSHWREFHERSVADLDESGLRLLGYGFGDLEDHSIPRRVVSAVGVAAQLRALPDGAVRAGDLVAGRAVVRRMGLRFSQDALRQVCTMRLLRDRLGLDAAPSPRILVVGDGYGVLSALLREVLPAVRLVLVDLGKTLLFQAFYCQLAHPGAEHALVGSVTPDAFTYCPAESLDEIPGTFDLAINIASMQEMEAVAVAGYFRFMRERAVSWFYCCNRLRKVLPDGDISEFLSYPWDEQDEHIVDSPCPWHQWYVGAPPHGSGPRVLNFPIPFVHAYDGVHHHRLTRLASRPSGGSPKRING
jgi:hypothetical protein